MTDTRGDKNVNLWKKCKLLASGSAITAIVCFLLFLGTSLVMTIVVGMALACLCGLYIAVFGQASQPPHIPRLDQTLADTQTRTPE